MYIQISFLDTYDPLADIRKIQDIYMSHLFLISANASSVFVSCGNCRSFFIRFHPKLPLLLFMYLLVVGLTTAVPFYMGHLGCIGQLEHMLCAAVRLCGGISEFDLVSHYMCDVLMYSIDCIFPSYLMVMGIANVCSAISRQAHQRCS